MTPTEAMEARTDVVKARRDGGKGWHWIWAKDFDETKHALHDNHPAAPPAATTTPAPAVKRGKQRNLTEATNGDR